MYFDKNIKTKKKRIAVLFGGQSTEHEISLRSSINVIQAISQRKYDLTLIGVDKSGRWILYNNQDCLLNANNPSSICLLPISRYLAVVPGYLKPQLIDISSGLPLPLIDVIFPVLHGGNGENGSVQGLLQLLNIPFIGSSVLGSAICMDKDMTKRILRDAGIPVTPSITLLRSNNIMKNINVIFEKIGGLPLFIKPASQGSSIGVSKVINLNDFREAILLAFQYDTKILIEKEINGREIEVAILGNDLPEVSVCGEVFTGDTFYTYKTKYFEEFKAELPAKIPIPISRSIQEIAKKAYLALNCSIMARVDFFLTSQGQIFLNEVNTLPGFTSISMYPKLWEASGLDFTLLMDRLISLALARNVTTKPKLQVKKDKYKLPI
ncbi:D-alanine--D-alanine ligase [Sodalis sp. CWE]|uniref:D-alanine--D-alanine ligase n=1 Tax=Sodalis sp. CWE TaxID=2803816 RepID=UPI001C7D91EA|nr:D-alanine--D-alanine ligase [Sodalis sp. CWE]MBX4180937.1 D-alanine--D-alanine ligase [Sodalis sp. CWE]